MMGTSDTLPGQPFPHTRYSAIRSAASSDHGERQRGLDTLAAVYWRPVYTYLRLKWKKSREDARDLAQDFFVDAVERDIFSSFDPRKARFRTFLRVCLDRFVLNDGREASRQKRGGEARFMPLEWDNEAGEIETLDIASDEDIEERFDREWTRELFTMALAELKAACEAEGKTIPLAIFTRYDLERDAAHPIRYDDLAREFELPVTTVTNHLSMMRKRLRGIVLEKLRDVTATEEEFQSEARWMFGIRVP